MIEKIFDALITFVQYFMSIAVVGLLCAIVIGILLVFVLGLYHIIMVLI